MTKTNLRAQTVTTTADEQLALQAYIFRKQFFRQAIATTARERGLTISSEDAKIDYDLMVAHAVSVIRSE